MIAGTKKMTGTASEQVINSLTGSGMDSVMLKVTSESPYYYYIHLYAACGPIASSDAKAVVHRGNFAL